MSFLGKFAFLRERSDKGKHKNYVKTNLIYNPYTNKLQRTDCDKHKVNRKSFQAVFGNQLKVDEKDYFGSNILCPPAKEATRFLTYNPNGLPYQDVEFLTQMIRRCIDLHVHYCGFSEINLNTSNSSLSKKMKSAVEKFLSNGLFHMHNSRIHGNSVDYQPGGVAGWFHGKLSRKYEGVQFDSRGRWLSHQFKGKNKNLKVYTLYRVNNSSHKPGSGSAWEQQRLLLQKDKIETNPRKQVVRELSAVLQNDIKNGFSILLMGDLNEGVDDKEGTNAMFSEMGLLNVVELKFKHLPKTHKEGSRAIDHIWGTADVITSVTSCGFAPFNLISYSDHRAVFVDINLQQLLEDEEIRVIKPTLRTLKSTNPRRVMDYNKLVKNRWEDMRIDEKWAIIKSNIKASGSSFQNVRAINNLDKMINEMMMQSEDKATKISSPMNNPWSEKLHKAVQLVNDWRYRVREAARMNKNGMVDKKEIARCREEVEIVRQDLREIRKNAKKHRQDFQGEQAVALDKQMRLLGRKGGNYISMIKNTEEQSERFSRIQRVLKKKYSKAIQCIWIPDVLSYPESQRESINIYDIDVIWNRVHVKDGKDIIHWKPIENKFMIEKMLLLWQRKHFQQAGETPLTTSKWLKWLSHPEIQKQILEGSFEGDTDLPYETVLFLNYMIRSVPEEINHKSTFEEFTQYMRKARESTACSPSGRHYGHYKSLLSGNIHILYTLFDIFSTALDAGIILDRWSKTVTTLIEKKEGTPYIHKFRTIHIVEAELQFFTKVIFARRMMCNAEKHRGITDDQYGGRKQRQATSIILNKNLYYDIAKQTLTTAAYMDDDAKACYDRVIPQLAEIESQKWGLSYKAAI